MLTLLLSSTTRFEHPVNTSLLHFCIKSQPIWHSRNSRGSRAQGFELAFRAGFELLPSPIVAKKGAARRSPRVERWRDASDRFGTERKCFASSRRSRRSVHARTTTTRLHASCGMEKILVFSLFLHERYHACSDLFSRFSADLSVNERRIQCREYGLPEGLR